MTLSPTWNSIGLRFIRTAYTLIVGSELSCILLLDWIDSSQLSLELIMDRNWMRISMVASKMIEKRPNLSLKHRRMRSKYFASFRLSLVHRLTFFENPFNEPSIQYPAVPKIDESPLSDIREMSPILNGIQSWLDPWNSFPIDHDIVNKDNQEFHPDIGLAYSIHLGHELRQVIQLHIRNVPSSFLTKQWTEIPRAPIDRRSSYRCEPPWYQINLELHLVEFGRKTRQMSYEILQVSPELLVRLTKSFFSETYLLPLLLVT
ncbi:hypothetical protein Tco_1213290 [Tanacetum coccineum]